MLSPRCRSFVNDWKFLSASEALDDRATEEEAELVHALGRTLGNCGYFQGDLGVIVLAAVLRLNRP